MRYAVYYAPRPEQALANLGRSWLGRDAETGAAVPPPSWTEDWAAEWPGLTAEPRRYGFHGTLKPPFRLAAGGTVEALHGAVARLAADHRPVALAGLQPAVLDGFLALVETVPCAALAALADACVTELDRFRAPPTAAELARRRAAPLTPRQDDNLRRWGYPYVFDMFRFHMTLTGRVAERARRDALEALLTAHFGTALAGPVAVEDLCLFVEPAPGAPFTVLARWPLGGAAP